ncbi:MAG TPA: sulfate ABC transporter permease subunit CysT [Candidatus Angelobacter sp.]|nr:sulfate ABC transporter permease subunit CysT [Candidatus Angelobacter sp.]
MGRIKSKRVLPGFRLTLGFAIIYLSLMILIPLLGLFAKTFTMGWHGFYQTATSARVLASLRLSFGAAIVAAGVNAAFGVIIAWVLVRYKFPGKRFFDALVDIPFALPTAVAGIALTQMYTPHGWIGKWLAPLGIKVAFTPLGIVIALVFTGLPFVVRTVQPVLASVDPEIEEAAATLGAGRARTFFRVLFPEIVPALLTGFALAFARGAGEYGSVVFISGNLPFHTEIAPLLIITKLDQYDYTGATALAVIMLAISFSILLFINFYQHGKAAAFRHGAL